MNKKTITLSEFRATLQLKSSNSKSKNRNDRNKTAIAQRISDMINVSRELSAVRDR